MRKECTANSTTCRSGCEEILVIAPNWLGDAVMSTPFLSVLRSRFPSSPVTVACRSYVSEVFSDSPFIDRLLEYDGSRGLRGLVASIRANAPARGWSTCFVLPTSFSSAVAAFLSRAGTRVGYGGEMRSIFLNRVRSRGGYREGHLTRVYIKLVEEVSGTASAGMPLPSIEPPAGWREMISSRGIQGDYFVLAAGAAYGPAKVWSADRYSLLARRIVERRGWSVVTVGSGGESREADGIIETTGGHGINMAGKCSVRELVAVLRGARLVIGNDSGPVHISAAMGVPTVTVFGSTSPEWTAPMGTAVEIVKSDLECSPCFKRECPYGEPACMLKIGVGDVHSAVQRLLKEEIRDAT